MQPTHLSNQQLLQCIATVAKQKSMLLVAIDGYAGAGKSTLATWLAERLESAQIISLDDFYRPLTAQQWQNLQGEKAVQGYFKVQQFMQKVLLPLQNNSPVSWRPIDWLSSNPLPEKTAEPYGVIIIEGVFACHQALLEHVHLSLMVDTGQLQRQQRVLARPQEDSHWYQHWATTEDWYHQNNGTRQRVDYLYSGAGKV